MKTLVIKPTLKCTCNCVTCLYNSERFDRKKYSDSMSFLDWKKVISDASNLGAKRLHISGGEPTLLKDLVKYVKYAKKKNYFVNLNTNGRLVSRKLVKDLLSAGLDSVTVSLYSSKDYKHDKMRGGKKVWKHAVNAIRLFDVERKKYPLFEIKSMSILSKENYKDFVDLLKLNYKLGADCFYVSYLEGDYDKKYLMTEKDIEYFKSKILPELLRFSSCIAPIVRNKYKKALKSMFSIKNLGLKEWAAGLYGSNRLEKCKVPSEFAIVLSNGDVVPCYMVEYKHDRIIGNVLEDTFMNIWNGGSRKRFLAEKYSQCKICPMHLHTWIPLRFSRFDNTKRHYIVRGFLDKVYLLLKKVLGN